MGLSDMASNPRGVFSVGCWDQRVSFKRDRSSRRRQLDLKDSRAGMRRGGGMSVFNLFPTLRFSIECPALILCGLRNQMDAFRRLFVSLASDFAQGTAVHTCGRLLKRCEPPRDSYVLSIIIQHSFQNIPGLLRPKYGAKQL